MEKSDNELIAEFMGIEVSPVGCTWYDNVTRKRLINVDDLEYHTSWDWLMPVVEKIREYRLAYPDQANKVCNLKVVVMRDVLYKRVVEFIKFYNSQSEK